MTFPCWGKCFAWEKYLEKKLHKTVSAYGQSSFLWVGTYVVMYRKYSILYDLKLGTHIGVVLNETEEDDILA